MAKSLLIAALPEELGSEAIAQLESVCDICFTGVGKLRAFEATLEALEAAEYDNVINIGTCGSAKHPFATVLRPSRVVQGDIYLEGLFATEQERISTSDSDTTIVSSDNFIGEETPAAQLKRLEPYDCMDMESYAIVRAVKYHARTRRKELPKIYMLKVVSDGADGSVGEWSQRIERLRPTLLDATKELIAKL